MKPKVLKHDRLDASGGQRWSFYCPGCQCGHTFIVGGGRGWSFNEDRETPTVSPSLLTSIPEREGRPAKTLCHLFVEGGRIRFLDDCDHALKGQTVPVPDWPENYGTEGMS